MINYKLTQTGEKIQSDLDLVENLQSEFSAEERYSVGDLVRYNKNLYKCVVDVLIPGEWTGQTNWLKVELKDLLDEKLSKVHAEDIDTEELCSGLVLTSNGAGSTLWVTPALTDIQLNGQSIVNNNVGLILTSGAVVSHNNVIELSLTQVPAVNPRELTIQQQSGLNLYIDDNGTAKKTSLNDLDYTKFRVVESEQSGLNTINKNDFLFVKN